MSHKNYKKHGSVQSKTVPIDLLHKNMFIQLQACENNWLHIHGRNAGFGPQKQKAKNKGGQNQDNSKKTSDKSEEENGKEKETKENSTPQMRWHAMAAGRVWAGVLIVVLRGH